MLKEITGEVAHSIMSLQEAVEHGYRIFVDDFSRGPESGPADKLRGIPREAFSDRGHEIG